jgi:hypothetical protein
MRSRARLAAALVCGALAATGFAAASFTQPLAQRAQAPAQSSTRPAKPPYELWGKYPLGESTVETSAPAAQRRAVVSEDSEDDMRQTLLVGLAALGLLVLALATLWSLRFRQRRLVAESRQELLAIMALPAPAHEKIGRAQAFAAGLGCDMVSGNRPHARGKHVTDESEVKSPMQEGSAGSRGYAEFGDRVAAVLQAAEEAAHQIRSDAQTAAEQMTRHAEQSSKTMLEEAKAEAQRVRLEADTEAKNTREAVESYATTHRREAEEKAAKTLAEADAQARAAREAAEAMAQRIEEGARSLEEEVREQERMIRGRMQRYLAALRDVSSQIEEVMGETERAEPTLVEALDPERANQEQATQKS